MTTMHDDLGDDAGWIEDGFREALQSKLRITGTD